MKHPKEIFCDNIVKTMRAISGTAEPLPYHYEQATPPLLEGGGDSTLCLSLTETKEQWLSNPGLSPKRQTHLRAQGDAIALRLKFHDAAIHATHRPSASSPMADAYDAMEETRLVLHGCGDMMGASYNLQTSLTHLCDGKKEKTILPLCLRMILLEAADNKHPYHDIIVTKERIFIKEFFLTHLHDLTKILHDQNKFAQKTSQFLTLLEQKTHEQEEEEASDPSLEQEDMDEEEEEAPPPSGSQTSSSDEDDSCDEAKEQEKKAAPWIALHYDSNDGHPSISHASDTTDSDGILQNYRPYSTAYDAIRNPSDLVSREELRSLRQTLNEQVSPYRDVVARLAKRVQRRLLAQKRQCWQLDCEDGMLDGSRLARLVANPFYQTPWKQEHITPLRHTIVSLLIDNSGSMRGRPIALAAMCADILACTLERCGVKCEILGFTTREWKGGRVREEWNRNGKPKNPGRLNELLHIIYKDAELPMRHGRNALGFMLKEGLLKENIDGEALMWAQHRLMRRSEQRRILLVISDGAPVDDSSFSSNYGNLLEDHLTAMVRHIEDKTPIELKAIGIGHDVSRYYRQAVTIMDATQLGSTLLEQMEQLFLPLKNPS